MDPSSSDAPASGSAGGLDNLPSWKQKKFAESNRTDVILPIKESILREIVTGRRFYEFRRWRFDDTVERIWYYSTAPEYCIKFICEIMPAQFRGPGQLPILEDGIGAKEYNERHIDYRELDYAYRILRVYRLRSPLSLYTLRDVYGLKSPPRSMLYLPRNISEAVDWEQQEVVL